MDKNQKKEKLIEARNKITLGIKILREVFNESKEDWNNKKGFFPSMAIAMGHSQDIVSRLDDSISKIEVNNEI